MGSVPIPPELEEEAGKAVGDAASTAGSYIGSKLKSGFNTLKSGVDYGLTQARALQSKMERTEQGSLLFKHLDTHFNQSVDSTKAAVFTAAKKAAGGDLLDLLSLNLPEDLKSKIIQGHATGQFPHQELHHYAVNKARAYTLGNHDAIAAAVVKSVADTHGYEEANNLSDALNTYFRDSYKTVSRDTKTFRKMDPAKRGAEMQNRSAIKDSIIRGQEDHTLVEGQANYKHPGAMERGISNYAHVVFNPALLLSHIGTPMNFLVGVPLKSFVKGIGDLATDYGGVRELNDKAGILAANLEQGMRERADAENGVVFHLSGSKRFGKALNYIAHTPGYREFRGFMLNFGGAVAKSSIEDSAERFASNPNDRMAKSFLEGLGVNTNRLLENGGKLQDDEFQRAMYKFVNERTMIHTNVYRSTFGQDTMLGRLTTMYHGYISAEGRLIYRELSRSLGYGAGDMLKAVKSGDKAAIAKMLKSADYVNFAKTLTTMGVAFPSFGYLTMHAKRLARGEGWDNPEYDKEDAFHKYLTDLSYIGAFSIGNDYIRAASRHQLADEAIGPIGNTALNTIQDAAVGFGMNKASSREYFYRDLLENGLPDNIGKFISNKFLPTKTEQEEEKRKNKLSGLKGIGGLKGLPKL